MITTVVACAAAVETSNPAPSASYTSFIAMSPDSNPSREWGEIGTNVKHFDPLAALEPADDGVGARSEHAFPRHLQDELAEHHLQHRVHRPIGESVEGERIKDQAVRAFPDDGAANGPGPERAPLGPDLHFREDDGIEEIAHPERRHRSE